MKILITGSSGLLGRSLTRVIRRNSNNHELFTPTREELDLLNVEKTKNYFKNNNIECILHCAAKVAGIQANIDDPVGFMKINSIINLNLINIAAENNIRKIINFGSSCMYPSNYKNPLKEEYLLASKLETTNEGYAIAKIMGAKLCEYYSRQYGMEYRTLIPCNLYGPDDKYNEEYSHLIAAIIIKLHKAIREKKSEVKIWGDGKAKREFIYVDDLSEFVYSILGKEKEIPQYMNVGFGRDYTINEYYKIGSCVTGYCGRFIYDRKKPVGMMQKLMDSTRAEYLGWKPKTRLKDGMLKTYKHFLNSIR